MRSILVVCLLFSLHAQVLHAADPAPAKVKWLLAKLVDREGKETYQAIDSSALATLQSEIKKEEGLFDKAMMMADKAWRADESTKSKMFPRSAIGHRSVTVVSYYTSSDAASKALTAMEEKMARAEENKAEAERKREENRAKYNTGNSQNMPKKKDTKKSESEKRGLEDQARNLFISELEKLKAGKPDPKDAAPANKEGADGNGGAAANKGAHG